VRATMRLVFDGGGLPPNQIEVSIEREEKRTLAGEASVADQLAVELKKEFYIGDIVDGLPDVSDFHAHTKQSFSLDEIRSSSYFDRRNTRWVWHEIGQNLLRIRHLLTEARAYKALEGPKGPADKDLIRLYNLHLTKMEHFDLAAFYLAKIEDLLVRLIFENLGGSLIAVNPNDANWERRLTWDRLKEALKVRGAKVAADGWWTRWFGWMKRRKAKRVVSPDLDSLSNTEYEQLRRIVNEFKNPDFVAKFVSYRDRVAHRITPSVDYPEMYTHLESRQGVTLRDGSGLEVGTSWGLGAQPVNAEYDFIELYEGTVKTLEHWLRLLRRLKSVPRFSPEATR